MPRASGTTLVGLIQINNSRHKQGVYHTFSCKLSEGGAQLIAGNSGYHFKSSEAVRGNSPVTPFPAADFSHLPFLPAVEYSQSPMAGQKEG